VLLPAPGVDELLDGAGSHRGKQRLPADDAGEVLHVDVLHLPGNRLLRPGGELTLVNGEQFGELDRPGDCDRLFEPAVGEEEESEVRPLGDDEPAPLDQPQVLFQSDAASFGVLVVRGLYADMVFPAAQTKDDPEAVAPPFERRHRLPLPVEFFGGRPET
jgi:hypothetical protein